MAELCEKTIVSPRSLNEYWREAVCIMKFLKFSYLLKDSDNISDCVEEIMNAELNHDENRGKLSTFKFKCVENKCKKILRAKQTKKKKVRASMKSLSLYGGYAYTENLDDRFDFQIYVDKVQNSNRFNKSQKECFYNYYVLGMTYEAIAQELGISRQRVAQKIQKVLNRI